MTRFLDHAVNLKISFLQIEQAKKTFLTLLFYLVSMLQFTLIPLYEGIETKFICFYFRCTLFFFFLSTFVFDWGENFKYLLENRSFSFRFKQSFLFIIFLNFFLGKTIFGSLVLCWGTLNNNMGCEFVMW